jgi:argininosuccinate synthase
MGKKVVLAYSGGLDTCVILRWLIAEKGYDVVAYIADVGQGDDFEQVRQRAYDTGASQVYVDDLKQAFVTDYVFPVIRANAIYEGRYLLGTSIARPLIARRHVEIARAENAQAVAHGATGKGNDQIRFELAFHSLAPELEIIAPWRDPAFLRTFKGRTDLIEYASAHGITVDVSPSKPYSNDLNLFHMSHEAGELEDPKHEPGPEMFRLSASPLDAPDRETRLSIEFDRGVPVKVTDSGTGSVVAEPVVLLAYLNRVAGENGIGRVDIVENRFVGLKSRGVYETPGGTILYRAHHDLEGITMDREVMHLRDTMSPKYAELIYNGLWFSPEHELLSVFFEKTQEYVTGTVDLVLYKGNVIIVGRESKYSLYDAEQSSMETIGSYNPVDASGFIRINALRLINAALQRKVKE